MNTFQVSNHLPTSEKVSSPTFDQPSSPTFAAKSNFSGSPTFEKAGSPTFERTASPSFKNINSSKIEEAGSPTFEKLPSPTIEKGGSSICNKAGSPTFEKAGSPTIDKAGSPTFEKAGLPTFENAGPATFEKAGLPTFEKFGSPTFEKAGSPTFEKSGSPTYEKAGSPTLERKSACEKNKAIVLEKSGFSTDLHRQIMKVEPGDNVVNGSQDLGDHSLQEEKHNVSDSERNQTTFNENNDLKTIISDDKNAAVETNSLTKCQQIKQPDKSDSKSLIGSKRKLTMKVVSPSSKSCPSKDEALKSGEKSTCNGISKKLRFDDDILVATPYPKSSEHVTNCSFNDTGFSHALDALPDGNLDLFEESEKKESKDRSVSTNAICKVSGQEVLTTGAPTEIKTCFTETPKRNGVIQSKHFVNSAVNIPQASTMSSPPILQNQAKQIIVSPSPMSVVITKNQPANQLVLPASPIVSSQIVSTPVVGPTQPVVVTSQQAPMLVQVPTSTPLIGHVISQPNPILLASTSNIQSVVVNSSGTVLLPATSNSNPVVIPQPAQQFVVTNQLIDNKQQTLALQNAQPIVIASPQKNAQKQLLVPVSILPQGTNILTARDLSSASTTQTTTTFGNSLICIQPNHSFSNLPASQILSPSKTVYLVDGMVSAIYDIRYTSYKIHYRQVLRTTTAFITDAVTDNHYY